MPEQFDENTSVKVESTAQSPQRCREGCGAPEHSVSHKHCYFGFTGAETYDQEVLHLPERYLRANALQNALIGEDLNFWPHDRPIVIDVGAGTGKDAIPILNQHQTVHYVGIDRSIAMLRRARKKLAHAGYIDRATLLCLDLEDVNEETLREKLSHCSLAGSVAVVTSALALHHMSVSNKRKIYRWVKELLGSRGRFVMTDLFAGLTSRLNELALGIEIEDISASLEDQPGKGTLTEHHYRVENTPLCLEKEFQLLQMAGFATVDTIYRDGQLAVICAELNTR